MKRQIGTGDSYRIRSARARARRAHKVNMMYGLIAAVMVLTIILACILRFGFSAQAEDGGAELNKYYTSVMITYEMSAEDYAEEYANPDYYSSETEYLKEVCEINHLAMSNGEIRNLMPGNYVILPYYAE